MAQKLVVPITFQIYQNGSLTRTETIAQDVIKIGRDQKSHLRLEDESVARMHAVIEARPDDVQIIDLGSVTEVNGQPINKCSLRSGDAFQVGKTRVVVQIGAAREASAAAPVASAAQPLAPSPVGMPATSPSPLGQGIPIAPLGAVAPFVSSVPSAQFTPSAPGSPLGSPLGSSLGSPLGTFGTALPPSGLEGDELYQLIKRGEINPHEVEDVGSHAVEVQVMWKSSILHVAHIGNSSNFTLTTLRPPLSPTTKVTGGFWGVGGALMVIGAAMADPNHLDRNGSVIYGGIGAALALVGSGVGISMASKNDRHTIDTSRFVVGSEVVGGASELSVVLNEGGSRFVFLPGATGEVELQGVKRSLEDLKSQGHARPSGSVPGGFEVNIQPEGRYRQEVGGLTIVAKVVAPGRVVSGVSKPDVAFRSSIGGSFAAVLAIGLIMRFAITDDSGLLSQGSDDDRLAELRAFIQRQQERQPEQEQQQNNDQQEGGTGTRHAGPEGKMGKRDAPSRSARYAIKNNGEPPHLTREAARDQVVNRGIFAALGAPGGGMSAGASGIVSPFGSMTESGLDSQNANGNMTGDAIGDAFGYGGLGAAGTGWGGGGTGEGTIGMGGIGTMGHGSGTGTGQGYGSGAGQGLRNRGTGGPTVRASPPQVTGLLSPEAIRRVVLRNLGQVTHCYEQGIASNPNIVGRVVVRFVIGGTGSVLNSSPTENTLGMPSVGDCVANAVRRWQFPSPEGGGVVTVNYPFNLQRADQ